MAEVIHIGSNRPRVRLLEYDDIVAKLEVNHIDGVACRILPLAIVRIEPMRVVKRQIIESARIRSIIISRDVYADDMVLCEKNFTSRKYVKMVLSVCASKTGKDLKNIYTQLAWPDSLDVLKNSVSSLPHLFPLHLKHCLRTTLRVMSFASWRLSAPFLLAPTWKYSNGWYWTVSLICQFEALLKSKPPFAVCLSVQSLILDSE